MATVDDAIRNAYKGRAERIQAIRDRAEDVAGLLASLPAMREVETLASLIAQLAAEVQ